MEAAGEDSIVHTWLGMEAADEDNIVLTWLGMEAAGEAVALSTQKEKIWNWRG
jgi:hypothetical protein